MNESEITAYQNMCDTEGSPKRDIYSYLHSTAYVFFLKKQQQKVSIIGMDLKALEKQEQIRPKSSRQEEIKIMAEINEMRKEQTTKNQGWQDDLVVIQT